MLNQTVSVFLFSKGTLTANTVRLGSHPSVTKSTQAEWNEETLLEVLKKTAKEIKAKNIRVLLDDDLVYTTEISIPQTVSKKDERSFILDEAEKIIPDSFSDKEWDYKITSSSKTEKVAFVFVPVVAYYRLISLSMLEASLRVESIEPVFVAKQRNEDPIIGAALKEDIRGNDSDVLNVQPSKEEILEKIMAETKQEQSEKLPEEHGTETLDEHADRRKTSWPFVLVGLIVVLVGIGIVVGVKLQLFSSSQEASPQASPTTVQQDNISLENSPTPSPTPMQTFDPAVYSIKVLNGSGVSGEAGRVADTLKAQGYVTVSTGNASNSEYVKTVIQVKDATASAQLIQHVSSLIESDYDVVVESSLQPEEESDLLIIIGRKK